jgi:hypothetical protein
MISEIFYVFGWNLQRATFNDGDTYSTVIRSDSLSSLSENWTLWTKGKRDVIVYPDGLDSALVQRKGKFVAQKDFADYVYKKGRYTVQAVGAAEFWCLNSTQNNNTFPVLTGIFLNANESYTTSVGDLILVASGETSIGTSPQSYEIVTPGTEIIAITETALIKFSNRK